MLGLLDHWTNSEDLIFNSSETMSQLTDVGSARIRTIDNFEIGYEEELEKNPRLGRFLLNFRKGFTDLQGVGPTYMLMGADLVGTWPTTVGQI